MRSNQPRGTVIAQTPSAGLGAQQTSHRDDHRVRELTERPRVPGSARARGMNELSATRNRHGRSIPERIPTRVPTTTSRPGNRNAPCAQPKLGSPDQIDAVQGPVDPERLAQPRRSRAEGRPRPRSATSVRHLLLEALDRLGGAQQDRAPLPVGAGHDVHTEVHPVREIDVETSRWAEHDTGSAASARGTNGSRDRPTVGLGLHDPHDQSGPVGVGAARARGRAGRGPRPRPVAPTRQCGTTLERRGGGRSRVTAPGPCARNRSSLVRGHVLITSPASAHPRCAVPTP